MLVHFGVIDYHGPNLVIIFQKSNELLENITLGLQKRRGAPGGLDSGAAVCARVRTCLAKTAAGLLTLLPHGRREGLAEGGAKGKKAQRASQNPKGWPGAQSFGKPALGGTRPPHAAQGGGRKGVYRFRQALLNF